MSTVPGGREPWAGEEGNGCGVWSVLIAPPPLEGQDIAPAPEGELA